MNEYYTKITRSEYLDIKLNVESDDFTKSEISYIASKTDFSYKKLLRSVYEFYKDLYIYKLPDEWFLVICKDANYKCDQMEGLIQLLNDL